MAFLFLLVASLPWPLYLCAMMDICAMQWFRAKPVALGARGHFCHLEVVVDLGQLTFKFSSFPGY